MNINILDIQKNQPLVTVSTYGCVANGKSSLIKFKKSKRRNIY